MRARRGLLHDVFVDGTECAVYTGDQVVVLSPIATTIVQVLGRHWTPVPELVHEVESIHGSAPHGEGANAVDRLLIELSDVHIVELHEFGP